MPDSYGDPTADDYPVNEPDPVNLLTGALIVGHSDPYVNDPQFKYAVDLLARMLPLWIDAIADDCARTADRRDAMIRQCICDADSVVRPSIYDRAVESPVDPEDMP